MLERLSTESKPEISVKCNSCKETTSSKEDTFISCSNCGINLTELAIASRQEHKNPDGSYSKLESLRTDAKTKKSYKVQEIPKIINTSAIQPRLPDEIKQLLILKREHMRELAKKRDPKSVTPNETKTQIFKDLKGACGAWNEVWGNYIGSEYSEFRTQFLNEIFSVAEFVNGKYKVLVTAVKEIMDTLILLGEVPEEYFFNYREKYDQAMKSENEIGILSANSVVTFASFYLETERSSVVTKRVARSIG
jgi:hypothetical protein